jgi:hypothetical protein
MTMLGSSRRSSNHLRLGHLDRHPQDPIGLSLALTVGAMEGSHCQAACIIPPRKSLHCYLPGLKQGLRCLVDHQSEGYSCLTEL